MIKAVYPGSFDPVTNGHLDIVHRAVKIFDELWIVVMVNPNKSSFFTMQERVDLIKKLVIDLPNVHVDCHDGLLVDYLKRKNINVVVRGLRAITDFQYELEMALANKQLWNEFETVFLMTDKRYSFLSSSLVKEVDMMGGEISEWVPKVVLDAIKNKLSKLKR